MPCHQFIARMRHAYTLLLPPAFAARGCCNKTLYYAVVGLLQARPICIPHLNVTNTGCTLARCIACPQASQVTNKGYYQLHTTEFFILVLFLLISMLDLHAPINYAISLKPTQGLLYVKWERLHCCSTRTAAVASKQMRPQRHLTRREETQARRNVPTHTLQPPCMNARQTRLLAARKK